MLPGQVRECYNGFPDATYGLTKRPGFEHIANLGTGSTYDDGKWFYIKRDDDEEYVGVIYNGNIKIWNAVSGTACTVTYGTGAVNYLNGAGERYKIITVQDTSIVINDTFTVTAQANASYNLHRHASVELQYVTANTTYTIVITISSNTKAATYTTSSSADANTILSNLEADINALTGAHAALTVTRLSNSLEIYHPNATIDVHAEGGLDNKALTVIEDEAASVGLLPIKSVQNRLIKVINTDSAADAYWAKFVAHDGVSGEGYWEETVAPDVSPGLDSATMPHELVNTALNTFVFKKINYEDRLVGDDETNENPSFVGNKITTGFFHNNRLGFLSKDNVSKIGRASCRERV